MRVAIYSDDGYVDAIWSFSLASGQEAIIVPDDESSDLTHYVDVTASPVEWIERPEMEASYIDGVLSAPEGAAWSATLGLAGVASGVIDASGEEEIEFVDSGTYTLNVTLFPFLPWSEEIVID